MEYIRKYTTEDQVKENIKYKTTKNYRYLDKHGVEQPGHKNIFDVYHFAILALMEWGQQNTYAKEKLLKKNNLRFITYDTICKYEVKLLVSMMHWDAFNKTFKLILSFCCIKINRIWLAITILLFIRNPRYSIWLTWRRRSIPD